MNQSEETVTKEDAEELQQMFTELEQVIGSVDGGDNFMKMIDPEDEINLSEFNELEKILYRGTLKLDKFDRYMVIGI